MNFRLTPRARLDLAEHITRLAADDPDVAQQERDRLLAAMRLVAERPEIGRTVFIEPLRRPVRAWPVPPMIVYYEARADELVVLHVRHGARRPIEHR